MPDEPNFNEETLEAFRELESGGGTVYKSAEDMYADLGIFGDPNRFIIGGGQKTSAVGYGHPRLQRGQMGSLRFIRIIIIAAS